MRGAVTYEGKRYYVSGKDKTEVEINKRIKIKELEEGKMIESNMLLRDWAVEWLETYKSGAVNEKSYKDYKARLGNHILPNIGHIQLKKIKPIHLQKVLQSLDGYSKSRIEKIYQCMNQMFNVAVANGLISTNPAQHLEKPKGTEGTHRAITEQERNVILNVAEMHKDGLWVKILLFCGLRPGETERIQIMDFDFKKKTLHVRGTKNRRADRYVPVPAEILNAVEMLKKQPFDYLFTNRNGQTINRTNRRRMWNSFKKAMHESMGGSLYNRAIVPPNLVADDLVPYCLRHTYCTDLQDAGVPINVAKELMGHSDIALTAKIYTHYTEISFNNAAELIDNFRNGKAKLCNTNCNT